MLYNKILTPPGLVLDRILSKKDSRRGRTKYKKRSRSRKRSKSKKRRRKYLDGAYDDKKFLEEKDKIDNYVRTNLKNPKLILELVDFVEKDKDFTVPQKINIFYMIKDIIKRTDFDTLIYKKISVLQPNMRVPGSIASILDELKKGDTESIITNYVNTNLKNPLLIRNLVNDLAKRKDFIPQERIKILNMIRDIIKRTDFNEFIDNIISKQKIFILHTWSRFDGEVGQKLLGIKNDPARARIEPLSDMVNYALTSSDMHYAESCARNIIDYIVMADFHPDNKHIGDIIKLLRKLISSDKISLNDKNGCLKKLISVINERRNYINKFLENEESGKNNEILKKIMGLRQLLEQPGLNKDKKEEIKKEIRNNRKLISGLTPDQREDNLIYMMRYIRMLTILTNLVISVFGEYLNEEYLEATKKNNYLYADAYGRVNKSLFEYQKMKLGSKL